MFVAAKKKLCQQMKGFYEILSFLQAAYYTF